MKTTRSKGVPRVAHRIDALSAVVENWSHTHGTNPDGDIICVPCMAELLVDIHEMISKDYARTSDGKLVMGNAGLADG